MPHMRASGDSVLWLHVGLHGSPPRSRLPPGPHARLCPDHSLSIAGYAALARSIGHGLHSFLCCVAADHDIAARRHSLIRARTVSVGGISTSGGGPPSAAETCRPLDIIATSGSDHAASVWQSMDGRGGSPAQALTRHSCKNTPTLCDAMLH